MDIPRYAPDLPLPPYAFVPGHHPHPRKESGHMHGVPEPEPPPLDPANPRGSEAFLFGLDLFNRGYYWECHVWWEGLWHAHGRRGPVADLLKGLIRLGAAGVKAKGGKVAGTRDHAEAATRLFHTVKAACGTPYAGLDLARLAAAGEEVAANAESLAKAGPGPGAALGVSITL
ncbi:DUF309 domain-containing protein [bacterium]|nr:DUF309 domain-containing protein [bacterium]